MRRALPFLLLFLALMTSQFLFAQTTSDTVPPDDMPFALIVCLAMLGVTGGAFVVGLVGMSVVLIVLFGLITAGVLSTAVVVGLYKRSFAAAFKTFLLISCSLGGIATGLFGLWVVNRLFTLNLSLSTMAWSGIIGGLAGGILLGLCLYGIIRLFLEYTKKKLSF